MDTVVKTMAQALESSGKSTMEIIRELTDKLAVAKSELSVYEADTIEVLKDAVGMGSVAYDVQQERRWEGRKKKQGTVDLINDVLKHFHSKNRKELAKK